MVYQQLGTSSLRPSRIGFGCMSLEEDPKTVALLIHRAIDLGINFFDTADLYQKGLNEELVGKALKGKRNDVLIATKVGNQWRPDGSGWDWNPRKSYILEAVNKSLKRLQTDHIDLYQLHGGTIDDPIDETIEAFERLQQEGKIRYYGISSIRPNVIREYVNRSRIVSVMMQYSLLDRRPEESCLQLLKEKNIGVLARGPLAKGLLVDKPATDYLGYTKKEVDHLATIVKDISVEKRLPSSTALGFVLHHPAVTSAVAGIRTVEQLEEAVASITAEKLTGNERAMLADTLVPNKYTEHR